MIAKAFELMPEGFLDGPLDHGLTDFDRQGFDRVEVGVESRSLLPIGTPADDFPPAEGQVAEVTLIVGLSLGEWHGVFVLELGENAKVAKSA